MKEEINEEFDKATLVALKDYQEKPTDENAKKAEGFVKLQLENDKNNCDYYVRAQEVDNKTCEIDIEKQRNSIKNVAIDKAMNFVQDAGKIGLTFVSTVCLTKVIRKCEEDGWATRLPDLARFVFTKMKF